MDTEIIRHSLNPRAAAHFVVPHVVTSSQLSEDLVHCYRRNIKNGAWSKLTALAVAVGYINLKDNLITGSGIPANQLLVICETFAVSSLCVCVYEYAG